VQAGPAKFVGVVDIGGSFNFNSLGSFGVGIITPAVENKLSAPLLKKKKGQKEAPPKQEENGCPRVRDGLKTLVFWILTVCLMLGTNLALFLISNYKLFAI
jgi:hypothetical protein